jgi:hypothetical protein
MPIPATEMHTPELQRLLLLLESSMHFIVRQPLSKEQALDIKQRFSRPLGLLNKRFELRSSGDAPYVVASAKANES